MGRKREVADNDIERWRSLRSDGHSLKEIANITGARISTISRYTRDLGKRTRKESDIAARIDRLDDGIKEIKDRLTGMDGTIKEVKDSQGELGENDIMIRRRLEWLYDVARWFIPLIWGVELAILIMIITMV